MEQSISFFPKIQAWSEAQLENMLKAAKQTRLQLKFSAKIQYNSNCPEFNSRLNCHAAGQTRQTADTFWPWILDYLGEKKKCCEHLKLDG